jgi:hypothetical protein
MYYKKYSQEIIDGLVSVAASFAPVVKPSTHLNKLHRVVCLGMYESLQTNLNLIKNLNVAASYTETLTKIEDEIRCVLSGLSSKVNADIAYFEKQSIEYKMSCITKNKLLDVLPSEYQRHESMMHKDKDSADIEYVNLTRPLRKSFLTRFRKEIKEIEHLIDKAKLLTNKQ